MIIKPNDIYSNNSHCQGLFTFENGMSNTAKNPLSGTWTGTPYYSSTAKFGSKSLDLSSMNVLYSNNFQIPIKQGFFLSFWTYLKSITSSLPLYLITFRTANAADYIQIVQRDDGTVSFVARLNSTFYFPAESRPVLSLSNWHSIVLHMIEPTKLLMIIDGSIPQTITLPSYFSFTSKYVLFNSYYDASTLRQVDGYLDSLQIKTGCSIPESALYTTKNRES